jgi:hypothetical protein
MFTRVLILNFWSNLTRRFRFADNKSKGAIMDVSGDVGVEEASSRLCTVAVADPEVLSAKPEDAHLLKHHLGKGKGFQNPWDSYQDHNAVFIMGNMLK